MPLIPAICTQCGAQVEVDKEKEAAICSHCGAAFIVEKAIQNYTIHNATINADNVIVHTPVYETKIDDIAPLEGKELQEYLNEKALFGWDYVSQKTIEKKWNEGDYLVTETTLRLTFRRDCAAAWYTKELTNLEKEYCELDDKSFALFEEQKNNFNILKQQGKPFGLLLGIGIPVTIISLPLTIFLVTQSLLAAALMEGIYFLIPGLVLLIVGPIGLAGSKKKKSIYESENAKLEERQNKYAEREYEILQRCVELMREKYGKDLDIPYYG